MKKRIIPLLIIFLCFFILTSAYAAKSTENNKITTWILKNRVYEKNTQPTEKANNEIDIIGISFNNQGITTPPYTATLPASLQEIEAEAFEGTALTSIELPDSLESIGDYAFANIPTLNNIKIPNKTTFIGENAFKGSNQVTITSAPKSYARAWAQENSIPFSPIASFYAYNKSVQVPSITGNNTTLQKILLSNETIEHQNEKPTGRMTGELNASIHEECIAYHIQGRSPPMA